MTRTAAFLGRAACWAASGLVAVLIVAGIGGYLWLGRIGDDPLQPADAVIVLAGTHDGRESYGLELARQTGAGTLVLSDPYPANDPVMRRACTGRHRSVTVLCRRPVPATTRGEARQAYTLAREHHWRRIVVVSWSYHLPRARFIFSQCFSDRPGDLIMRAVPHHGSRSLAEWEYISLYQGFAAIKAIALRACD